MTLDALSFIYQCPCCEYVLPSTTLEGARAIRTQHVRTTHPWLLSELLWSESVLSEIAT